jgi:uncharacterized protein (DUF2236 family)
MSQVTRSTSRAPARPPVCAVSAAYYWAHATFFEAQIAVQDLFGDPLSRRQREQLFEESVTWYGRYGMTMRPVPRDYAAFERYWQRMFEEVLEPTSLARGAVDGGTRPPPPPSPRVPRPLWNVVGGSAGRAGAWLTRVTLPPEARAVLGVEIDDRDRAGLSAMQAAVRGTWPLVPRRYRMLPRARKAATRRV